MVEHRTRFVDQVERTNKRVLLPLPGVTNPADWHGEGGRPVVVPANLKEEATKRFAENQFNILASDLMALNRSINDQRSQRFALLL